MAMTRPRPTRRTAVSSPLSRNALAVALALSALPAIAQDKQDDKNAVQLDAVEVVGQRVDDYTVDNSSSATGLTLSLRETPQSVTVVTRERMEDQNLTSLRDVLDNTTGIYSNQWDTERVLFYSRGFLVDNLMVDGMPTSSGTNFNTGAVDETADTALFERIEIVRGATGLMSGAGSPGASINLVRKHANARSPELSLDLSAGSWSDYRVEADASAPLNASGSVRGRAVAAYEDTESYQDFYRRKKSVLYGIVDADLSDNTRLSLGFDWQDNKPRGNTWGSFPLFLGDGSPADWPRSVSTATDWSFWDRRTENAFAQLRHDFGNGWRLDAAAGWRRYREDMALFYVFGYPDPVTGEGLEPSAYRSDATITERTLDLSATGPFELFGRRHELVVGFNGSNSSNTGREYAPGEMAPAGNFFEWDGSYPEPAFDPTGVLLSDIDTRQRGFYAAARFSLADPLKLIAGARRAAWKVDSFYLYDVPPDGPPDYRAKFDYNETIPYAGLVYDVSRNLSVFASHTGIFQPQTARDADSHWLDPVEGRSLEAGIKGEFLDKRLNAALTVFQTFQDNVAAPAFDDDGNPILLPDGSQASTPIDGAKTRGVEIEAAGRVGEDWLLSFGWSRTLTRDADDQNVRTFLPATLLRAFATWTPSRIEGLTLGGGVNWQSQSSTFVGDPDGGRILRQRSVALVNLMARYRFSPGMSLQLNADNVLDRKYFVLDEYDNTYYGAPSSATLSLHLDF
jgi:outer-membrane receptor for ferric coprogen and ferric-rhodotorulic acid